MDDTCTRLERDFKAEIMGPMAGNKEFSSKAIDTLLGDLKRSNCSFDARKFARDTAKKMTDFLMASKYVDEEAGASIAGTIDAIEENFP